MADEKPSPEAAVVPAEAMPPGYVSAEDFLARRAGLSGSGIASAVTRGYKAVAEPVTNILASGIASHPLAQGAQAGASWLTQGAVPQPADPREIVKYAGSQVPLLNKLTGESPVPAGMGPAQFGAEAIIPQTPTQAAIMAATGGAGGLAARAGLGAWGAAGTRLGGSILGGAAGGAVDEEGSPVLGALTGAAQGLLGEAVGAGVSIARHAGVERATRIAQQADAVNVATAVGQIPRLQGVFAGMKNSKDLYDLALGEVQLPSGKITSQGLAKLSAAQEQNAAQIKALLEKRPPGPDYPVNPNTMYGSEPPFRDPKIEGMRAGRFPDPLGKDPRNMEYLPWDEARLNLSKLREMAFPDTRSNPLAPTVEGLELKERYAKALRTFREYLTNYDETGQAVKLFEEGRQQYGAGRKVLDFLAEAFKRAGAKGPIEFNSDRLMKELNLGRVEYAKALGMDGYQLLQRIVGRGEGPGYRDVFTPTGALAKISEMIPLPGPAYARMRIGMPELVGDPLKMAPMARTAIDLGVQAGTQPLAQIGRSALPPITLAPPQPTQP